MKKIGFIGIGVMGCAMAANLMKKDMKCLFTPEQSGKRKFCW